ncbi:hypothetical protein GWI33_007657 [Rhynchophorus ferrugineus]|uniref:Uncharacterized protein n=1 Tax=Rhynchophorus ferrugineus TaxID=354439 RepID=A0A834MEN6_RHYFE|nr:hypothetical protein GWI33_007657 [Rhynchophorus ferrugineus]
MSTGANSPDIHVNPTYLPTIRLGKVTNSRGKPPHSITMIICSNKNGKPIGGRTTEARARPRGALFRRCRRFLIFVNGLFGAVSHTSRAHFPAVQYKQSLLTISGPINQYDYDK